MPMPSRTTDIFLEKKKTRHPSEVLFPCVREITEYSIFQYLLHLPIAIILQKWRLRLLPLARKNKGCVLHRKCSLPASFLHMVLEHGTYSQKINQSNNLAGHNDDKPWRRAKICHQQTTQQNRLLTRSTTAASRACPVNPNKVSGSNTTWSHIKRKQHDPGAGKRSLKHKQNWHK